MANTVEFIYKLTDRMSATMTKIADVAANVDNKFNSSSLSVDRLKGGIFSLQGGFGTLAKAATAYFGITQAFSAGKWVANLGMDMEQTRAKFEVLLGSLDKGNKMIADLNKFADITPYENEDLIKNSETMLAFGINANKILPTLKMLGNVSMGNKEKLQGLTLAYSQMTSTGRLMGQDLLQMINQGFNPLLEISNKTGKSMAVLKKEMEGGKISSKMVEDAFRMATSEGGKFYNMMDKMSVTGAGKVSTFFGVMKTQIARLAERLNPYIGKIMDFGIQFANNIGNIASVIWKILIPVRALVTGLMSLAKFFSQNKALFMSVVVVLTILKIAMWEAALASKGLTLAFVLQYRWVSLVIAGQRLLNLTLLAHPFTAALLGISLLIGGLILLHKRTQESIDGLDEVRKKTAEYASDEKAELDKIFTALRQTNPKSKERNELVKQLKDMYPDLLKNMNLEKASLEDIEKAYNKIIDAIGRTAEARATDETLKDLYKQRDTYVDVNEEDLKELNRLRAEAMSTPRLESSKQFLLNKYENTVGEGLNKLNTKIDQTKNHAASLLLQDSKSSKTKETSSSQSGLDNVGGLTSGGAKPTNIHINFRNLIENFTMHPTTVTEGIDNISDELIEGMLRVVNSTNQIAGQ